jgi:hypothetical protein
MDCQHPRPARLDLHDGVIMTETTPAEPAWRTRYGPQQLRNVLGLTEWQHERATAAGVVPRPDAARGKWSGDVVRALHAQRVAIRRHAGAIPDLGASRAAEILSARLGINVEPHAIHDLAHQGRILTVGEVKGYPVYCGRTLETWTSREEIEQANITGERYTADLAAEHLGVRRADFDHLVARGWITPVAWGRGPYTAKKYSPDVPLYRSGDLTALLKDPAIDWDTARAVTKGQRSPLAALADRTGGDPR